MWNFQFVHIGLFNFFLKIQQRCNMCSAFNHSTDLTLLKIDLQYYPLKNLAKLNHEIKLRIFSQIMMLIYNRPVEKEIVLQR